MKIFSYLKWILIIPLYVVLSWIAVHFFALTGFFICGGFFLFWLAYPKKTLCILCKLRPENTQCHFCREPIDKSRLYPKDFLSFFLNFCLILIAAIFCLLIVFQEKIIIEKTNLIPSPKTVTLVEPDIHSFYINEVFDFDIKIENITQAINAAQFEIEYNPKSLEVLDVDFSKSFANIYLQKEVNDDIGYIRVSGGLPNPGFNEPQAIFATIYFKALTPGTNKINILPRSLVLANDGRGSNILKSAGEFKILILTDLADNSEPQSIEAVKKEDNVLGTTGNLIAHDFTKATLNTTREKRHHYEKKRFRDMCRYSTLHTTIIEGVVSLNNFILKSFGIKEN
jgi:hypothetical protein